MALDFDDFEDPLDIYLQSKPNQKTITKDLVRRFGVNAVMTLSLPKRPSTELLLMAYISLWHYQPSLKTDDVERLCEHIQNVADKMKEIIRAYPAAIDRIKPLRGSKPKTAEFLESCKNSHLHTSY